MIQIMLQADTKFISDNKQQILKEFARYIGKNCCHA